MMTPITGRQMKRLQTLWGLFAPLAHMDAKDRAARVGWVGEKIGRAISSFKDMSSAEADTAIDAVQKHLPPELVKRASRRTAHGYGTAGRKRGGAAELQMADAATLQLMATLYTKLGWTRERLDAFLRSPKSPVRGGMIRTLAEANRVIWVLKSLLRRETKERTDGHQPGANNF